MDDRQDNQVDKGNQVDKSKLRASDADRQEVIERMVAEAEAKGGDAVVAFRFDTSEMGGTWTEICAYGTAVRATKL